MNLLVSCAPSPGRTVDLVVKRGVVFTIGRSQQCDLVLNQDKVSGVHARLVQGSSDSWMLEDMNSTNGTYLDGARVASMVPINKPSTIRLGVSGPILRVQPQSGIESTQHNRITKSNQSTGASCKPVSQHSLNSSARSQRKDKQPIILLSSIVGFCLVGAIAIYSIIPKKSQLAEIPTAHSDTGQSRPENSIPPDVDAATEIASKISFFPDPLQPGLSDEAQYRKGIGDMARVQAAKMIRRDQARNFPAIVIGRQGLTNCETPLSAGVYNLKCNEILVGFESELRYEYPIEVLYVLAHEYAHHLVEISVGSSTVSGLDNELTADCFAGYMAGYWNSHGKLTQDELNQGFAVMQAVAKVEPSDSTDMHGDPGQRKGAFFAGFERANGRVDTQYHNFCKTLDRILRL